MDNEKMPQIMPSAPPLEKALPGPPSVSDQLIETPSAPPMDQSGAIELSEDYEDHHIIESHDTIVKIPLNDLRSELNIAREQWRQATGNSSEADYPRFLQRKYYPQSNYNKNTSKKFQPTQYQIHTKSVDASYEEIE